MLNRDSVILSSEERQKKITMLNDMKHELEKLERQQKHIILANLEIYKMRLTKIISQISKRMVPYLASAVITFFILKLINCTPFVEDKIVKELETKKEFDSLGNIRYETQYGEFSNKDNIIKIYDSWVKVNDDYYEREVKTYKVKKLSEKKIEEIVENNILSLDDLLGIPTIHKEKRNNLTNDEINILPFVQAVVYSSNEEDKITVTNFKKHDIYDIIIWIFFNIFIDYIIFPTVIRRDQNIHEYIRSVNEEYPTVNVEEIKKILAIKQGNYNRMVK